MAVEFKGSNAVVLAPPHSQLNPAVFTQVWMIGHLEVAAGDFVDQGTIQLPMLFNAVTSRFQLLVMQDRVQVTPSLQREDGWEEEGDMVRRVIGGALGPFPDLPYSAIGLNFWWTAHSDGRPNSETSRRLFFAGDNPLFRIFDAPDACFGAYVSKDLIGFRLKVHANPITEQGEQPDATRVLFSFNFHQDLAGENRVAQVDQLLSRWNDAKAEASRIVEQVNAECGL